MMTAALKGFKMTLNNFTTKTLFTEWKSTWVLGCLQAMIHWNAWTACNWATAHNWVLQLFSHRRWSRKASDGKTRVIQHWVNDTAWSDWAVPFAMHIRGIPGGNLTVKVAVVRVDVPVDVLCEDVREQSVKWLLYADLSKRRREERDEEQRSTDEHHNLRGVEEAWHAGTDGRSDKQPHFIIASCSSNVDAGPVLFNVVGQSSFAPTRFGTVYFNKCENRSQMQQ